MASSTTIEYEYRDGSNYRKSGSWTVSGTLAPQDAARLTSGFDEGFFVPSAVGIPMLSPGGNDAGDDDHAWHTLESLKAGDAPVDEDRSIDQILAAFLAADWQAAMVAHSLETGRVTA
jgi:hypothetical protein